MRGARKDPALNHEVQNRRPRTRTHRYTRAGFWRGFCISIEWKQNRIGQSGRQMAGDQQADR